MCRQGPYIPNSSENEQLVFRFSPRREILPSYTVDINTPLLLPSKTLEDQCQNLHEASNRELEQHQQAQQAHQSQAEFPPHQAAPAGPSLMDPGHGALDPEPECLGQAVFTALFLQCISMCIYACTNHECIERKAILDSRAPKCTWIPFRDFILTLFSCQPPHYAVSLESIVAKCFSGERKKLSSNFCVDVLGVVDLCRWIDRVIRWALAIESNSYEALRYALVKLSPRYDSVALGVSDRCQDEGICPYRVWNLGTRTIADVFHIANMALSSPITLAVKERAKKWQHSTCTQQFCVLNNINATNIEQLHKCAEPGSCDKLTFPPEILNDALAQKDTSSKEWQSTAWCINRAGSKPDEWRLCRPAERYLAVSHVWMDGTGSGTQNSGLVNSCLFVYFSQFARQLDCQGIWWDAICVPTERDARRRIMNTMLKDYENAAVTVIHDEELVHTDWKDDGSPVVALVLSTWFTRGWTAAELYASRAHPVKVLFRNPNDRGGPPLMRDLDSDIMAYDPRSLPVPTNIKDQDVQNKFLTLREKRLPRNPDRIPSLGHFAASDIISRLRPPSRGRGARSHQSNWHDANLRDVLHIFRSRTTSWARDRLRIPGIMLLPTLEFDSPATDIDITKQLLRRCRQIDIADLPHDKMPVARSGPWSWCPPSIFDLHNSTIGRTMAPDVPLAIDDSGCISGSFRVIAMFEGDQIIPYSSNSAVHSRINQALEDQSSVLLTHPNGMWESMYILAQPVSVSEEGENQLQLSVSCRWIGCVYLRNPVNETSAVKETGHIARSAIVTRIVFGNDCGEEGHPLPAIPIEAVFAAVRASTQPAQQSCTLSCM